VTIITRPVPYQDEQTQLTGVLASDDAQSDRRPGILLVHGGGGLDEHAKEQAERYAALGYVRPGCSSATARAIRTCRSRTSRASPRR
jgi:hypothetical protein